MNRGGEGGRGRAKQKQEIWRFLLFCTLLAHQVCASVNVCVCAMVLSIDAAEVTFLWCYGKITMPLDQYKLTEKKKEIKQKAIGGGRECMTALMKATRTAFSPSGIIFYFLYLLGSCAERERE